MFVERKLNTSTGAIELWWCEREKGSMAGAKKFYVNKIVDEAVALGVAMDSLTEEPAICWAYGRTLGNIAVFSPTIVGNFPSKQGSDAVLPCDFVTAGKFAMVLHDGGVELTRRTGGPRRTRRPTPDSAKCGAPITLRGRTTSSAHPSLTSTTQEVGIWCSMPAALSTFEIRSRPPKIHVHVRPKAGGPKTIDRDFEAVSLRYANGDELFAADALAWVGLESARSGGG
jgi:hypothetical protein